MGKLFSWLSTSMAIACLLEIASNPKQAIRDIQRGPMPELEKFDCQLNHPIGPPAIRPRKILSHR